MRLGGWKHSLLQWAWSTNVEQLLNIVNKYTSVMSLRLSLDSGICMHPGWICPALVNVALRLSALGDISSMYVGTLTDTRACSRLQTDTVCFQSLSCSSASLLSTHVKTVRLDEWRYRMSSGNTYNAFPKLSTGICHKGNSKYLRFLNQRLHKTPSPS